MFEFVKAEWPVLYQLADRAEQYARFDPYASGIYSRRALEAAVGWLYAYEGSLVKPYQNDLNGRLAEPTFKALVEPDLLDKMHLVRRTGNRAAHDTTMTKVTVQHAVASLRALFHSLYWLARTYTQHPGSVPSSLTFNPASLPAPKTAAQKQAQARKTRAEIEALDAELAAKADALEAERAKNTALEAELAKARAQAAKKANSKLPDTHNYDEATTRSDLIDDLLAEAGWPLAEDRDREFPVPGAAANGGTGYPDYVLWGDDGLPLAVVEAKRTSRDPMDGLKQAEMYADGLEKIYGRRPVIFTTNGNEHRIYDDAGYQHGTGHPPRKVAGFYTKDELEWMHQRRKSRRAIHGVPLPEQAAKVATRDYQSRAIRAVAEDFDDKAQRGALLVMATGTGKTRTVIGLVDTLLKAGWVRRVLFLADRDALVRQTVRAFAKNLPDVPAVDLRKADKAEKVRIYVSTYPKMMNEIDKFKEDGTHKFGPGFFDLVVIDEAHRSVYQKYQHIFRWFDSLLVGLTATPKDEVDRNTYSLFGLEQGIPTDFYPLDQAIEDEWLVPPRVIDVPLKFPRQGVRYEQLLDEEKDQWDALDWGEGVEPPDDVDGEALNNWLFNTDTVDKALKFLMEKGHRVEGGDRIAKTIVFAKNQRHARFIVERFDHAYPYMAGKAARVIISSDQRAQATLDEFSDATKQPDIAVTVDMLDTGVDVPEVANLLFFKRVFTSSKFWQMIGRGTRLRPDLFGPGQDKGDFFVFDLLGNAEWFNQDLPRAEGRAAKSLHARTFATRVDLLHTIDHLDDPGEELAGLRDAIATRLHETIAGMNLDNFIVRDHRSWVETYANREAWSREKIRAAGPQGLSDLIENLGELPTADRGDGTDEKAKRFDLMMLTLQLGILRADVDVARVRENVRAIASALLENLDVSDIATQAALLDDMAGEEWWQDVTTPMLEVARLQLRGLVGLITQSQQKIVYTDLIEEIGEVREVELTAAAKGVNAKRFRQKAQAYLAGHLNNLALQKLRRNKPLTQQDLDELGRMLVDAQIGTEADVIAAAEKAHGLGRFIRSLVGLERETVEEAFATFLQDTGATRAQQDFVRLVIDHLTDNGGLDPNLLWEDPFNRDDPSGVSGIFPDPVPLVEVIRRFNNGADLPPSATA
ncbi:DEAD/DEAH box helicase family protein [Streptomyces violarus]|uniref:DEAD/DEAH box helicase family protein n=1 Tax=Streptomyces violarus TaxID=67380 RepID=UPI0021BFDEDA|nr:DEAD/DEAH box helicase family protein [Streptomyces violarus]MCT9140261.1 DEAD/DEAH box helicase family protein [Streptomyces violarus]